MSWSRSYTGSKSSVLESAVADIPAIEANLPEFERADVRHVVKAAECALAAVDVLAKVTLNLSGHGHRDAKGNGAGSLGVSISYTIAGESHL